MFPFRQFASKVGSKGLLSAGGAAIFCKDCLAFTFLDRNFGSPTGGLDRGGSRGPEDSEFQAFKKS